MLRPPDWTDSELLTLLAVVGLDKLHSRKAMGARLDAAARVLGRTKASCKVQVFNIRRDDARAHEGTRC